MKLVHFSFWCLMKPQTARARRPLLGAAVNSSHLHRRQFPGQLQLPPLCPRTHRAHTARSIITNTALVTHCHWSRTAIAQRPPGPVQCLQTNVQTLTSPELEFQHILTFYWSRIHRQESPQITGTILDFQKATGTPSLAAERNTISPAPGTPPSSPLAPGMVIILASTHFLKLVIAFCTWKSYIMLCTFLCPVQRALKM